MNSDNGLTFPAGYIHNTSDMRLNDCRHLQLVPDALATPSQTHVKGISAMDTQLQQQSSGSLKDAFTSDETADTLYSAALI